MAYGTHDLRDQPLLAFGGANLTNTSVAAYGEREAYAEFDRVLAIHNALLSELRDELCQVTTDYQAVYGGLAQPLRMVRGNEYSNPLAQKTGAPAVTMGFPLEKSEIGLQWTHRGFQRMSLERFRLTVKAALMADAKDFRQSLMRAIFNPSNTPNFEDYLVDFKTIPLYAFLNGDGKPVPVSQDGTTFSSSHTHYTFATALNEAVIRDVITNVAEHDISSGNIQLFIPRTFENAVWAMQASGAFYPFRQEGVVLGANATYAEGQFLDKNPLNRSIGIFDGNIVKVRSWVPPGYIVAIDVGAPGDKPLAYRIMPDELNADLGLRWEDETYPLRAEVMDRFYGIAPWQRHKVAVCYIASGANAYVAPNIYPGL